MTRRFRIPALLACALLALTAAGATAKTHKEQPPRISLSVRAPIAGSGAIVVSGRVTPAPPHGQVAIQARSGGRWRQLARVPVRHGHFKRRTALPAGALAGRVRASLFVDGHRVAVSAARAVRSRPATVPPKGPPTPIPAPTPAANPLSAASLMATIDSYSACRTTSAAPPNSAAALDEFQANARGRRADASANRPSPSRASRSRRSASAPAGPPSRARRSRRSSTPGRPGRRRHRAALRRRHSGGFTRAKSRARSSSSRSPTKQLESRRPLPGDRNGGQRRCGRPRRGHPGGRRLPEVGRHQRPQRNRAAAGADGRQALRGSGDRRRRSRRNRARSPSPPTPPARSCERDVWGELEGADPSRRVFVGTPASSFTPSASEHGSGVAITVGLARHYAALPKSAAAGDARLHGARRPRSRLARAAGAARQPAGELVQRSRRLRPPRLRARRADRRKRNRTGRSSPRRNPTRPAACTTRENPLLEPGIIEDFEAAGVPTPETPPFTASGGEQTNAYAAGIPTVSFSGASLFFHTAGDLPSTVDPTILDKDADAFRRTVDTITAIPPGRPQSRKRPRRRTRQQNRRRRPRPGQPDPRQPAASSAPAGSAARPRPRSRSCP